MGQLVDTFITYRILKLLVTPFKDTDAFRLGIIDRSGKELKSISSLNTAQEREAYTLLHRLVFRLKKIIEKVPIENKKLLSLAAAYSLIRESLDLNKEPIDLENQFINKLGSNLNEEIIIVENFFVERKIVSFKNYTEEMGGVPANNAAVSPGVAGVTGEPPVKAKNKLNKKIFRRFKDDKLAKKFILP